MVPLPGVAGYTYADTVRQAAGTNLGCRVENLVGSNVPTLMSSWVALMLVLAIQELPRLLGIIEKVLAKLKLISSLEEQFKSGGPVDPNAQLEKAFKEGRTAVEAAASAAAEDASAAVADPMAQAEKLLEKAATRVMARLVKQFKVTFLVISIGSFISSTWLSTAWEPTVINATQIDTSLAWEAAVGIDCSLPASNCAASGLITVGGDSKDCVGALVYDEVLDGNGDVDIANSLIIQMGAVFGGTGQSTGDLAFYGMLARAPLSSKLAVTWMIVIASIGEIIRGESAAKEAYAEAPTLGKKLEALRARVALLVLLPVILVAVAAIFFVLLLALVAALFMLPLIGIWVVLAIIIAVHYPLGLLWRCLGVAPKPVDTSKYTRRSTKLLLQMSEGPLFKYYFTCYLHVATVVLQLFVQMQSMSSNLGQTNDEIFAHVYKNFFGMTTVSLSASMPAIDFTFWMDFSNVINLSGVDIDLGNLMPTDFALVLTCKITYVLGLGMLVIEKILSLVERTMLLRNLRLPEAQPTPSLQQV